MDFSLTKEQRFFREQVSRAVQRIVAPFADSIDRSDTFPRDLFRELGSLGYYGIRYPEEIGGMGADCVMFTILSEELARASIGFAAIATMQCLMGTDFIHRFGTGEQKERCLFPAIRGEKIGTIAFTEPDCGSDLGGIKTRAVKNEKGYLLTGRKLWITDGDVADFVTVAATTAPEKRLGGIGFFLVEKGTPGFSVGQKIEKMSARGAATMELIFDGCQIPSDSLMGEEGKGAKYLSDILSEIRIMIAGLGLGLAKSAFVSGLRYARQREAFGRPIGTFQLIEEKIAEMEVRIRSAELHLPCRVAERQGFPDGERGRHGEVLLDGGRLFRRRRGVEDTWRLRRGRRIPGPEVLQGWPVPPFRRRDVGDSENDHRERHDEKM